MDYKLDLDLHKKIRELFPIEKGKGVFVEILKRDPLDLRVVHYDSDNFSGEGIKCARENRPYFMIDDIFDEPIFFYRDRFVTLKKNYRTDQVLRYELRTGEELELDMDEVRAELKQLAALLKSQAS